MTLLIWAEMLISILITPLRWIVRRFPRQSFVVMMLAVATLIAQVLLTNRVDPKLFTAVFTISLLIAIGMAATVWPMSIDDDRPQRPRHKPQKVEDWSEPVSTH